MKTEPYIQPGNAMCQNKSVPAPQERCSRLTELSEEQASWILRRDMGVERVCLGPFLGLWIWAAPWTEDRDRRSGVQDG